MTAQVRPLVSVGVGDSHAVRRIGPITQTDIVRFAGVAGDFNPLHHDVKFAADAGFPRPIAMGQMQAGMLAGWVSDWLGVEHLRSVDVRFVAPLAIGDTLTLSGEISVIEQSRDGSVATVELRGTKDDEALVVKGTARALVATTSTGGRPYREAVPWTLRKDMPKD
jgi:acyl dehydratase